MHQLIMSESSNAMYQLIMPESSDEINEHVQNHCLSELSDEVNEHVQNVIVCNIVKVHDTMSSDPTCGLRRLTVGGGKEVRTSGS